MNALYLTLFVSLVLAVGGVLLFVWGWARGDHEHLDRTSLLPLEEEAGITTTHVGTQQ